MLLGIFLNGFLLWDIQKSYKIETWIKAHHLKVESAFQLIAEFDALLSLGNFRFNHADYVFPHIDAIATDQISVESAIHPLLEKKVAIANDFNLQTENFVILTGANMAGKSTFLRTLALQIIMANLGLPVRAKKCIYRPIKLITSMRTTDSLADESSYFYAELTRLKLIVDTLEKENYFVILDEILKGTNSTDKAIGAQKFVKRLLREKAVGIIATHDLSLCTLEEESANIKNYYFDAEIIEDELFFDYRLKNGVCKNMNASFLLEKMGLV
jgi:DNA mismatch repair ATPase MutS